MRFGGLIDAIQAGNTAEAMRQARHLLEKGVAVEDLISHGLAAAMEPLGRKCTTEEFDLLEIMLAGRAVLQVVDNLIVPALEARRSPRRGAGNAPPVVVMGTIKGDVHELGKHVVRIFLSAAGFQVVDLGRDVDPARFVEAARDHRASLLGVSSLLSTTIPVVREIRSVAQEQGAEGLVIVAGGAALQQLSPRDLNVDYVARDAFDGLEFFKQANGRGYNG